jgi:hypothetical protein
MLICPPEINHGIKYTSWAEENSHFLKFQWSWFGRVECIIISPFLSSLDNIPHLIFVRPTLVLSAPSIIVFESNVLYN